MTDEQLRAARMSLAQAVTRSYGAEPGDLAQARAVDEHRTAAELKLRQGGREDLGYRIDHDLPPHGPATRANCREIMSLVDAALATPAAGFETAATDGGERDAE